LLCLCDIFQCLKLEFKSALMHGFFFTKLLEGRMLMENVSTFLTNSSFLLTFKLKPLTEVNEDLISLCISSPVFVLKHSCTDLCPFDLHS
jgi:hypothetical protein